LRFAAPARNMGLPADPMDANPLTAPEQMHDARPLAPTVARAYFEAGTARRNGHRPPSRSSPELDAMGARERVAELSSRAGLRLNHRAAWVLKIVEREPGLSNQAIAERAGGLAKSHASTLLARLKRAGLIENTPTDSTPTVANAWRLTRAGSALERSIREAMPGLGEGDSRRRKAGPLAVVPVTLEENPRHTRVLEAIVRIWGGRSVEPLAIETIARAARVSSEEVREQFPDPRACQLAAFDHAVGRAALAVRAAVAEHDGWLERVRAGLNALLALFEAEPALARVLVIESAQASLAVVRRRNEKLAELASAIDDESAPNRPYPPALIAEALIAGVAGVLHARLSERRPEPLSELLPALMGFLAMPYLGRKAARRELACGEQQPAIAPARQEAVAMLQGVSGRAVRDRRALAALRAIAGEPGLSNVQVGERAGIKDQGQTSRTLSRLARLGLIKNVLNGEGLPLVANAWELTSGGRQLYFTLAERHESSVVAAPSGGSGVNRAVVQTAPCWSGAKTSLSLGSPRRWCPVATCSAPRPSRRTASRLPTPPVPATARARDHYPLRRSCFNRQYKRYRAP
jgi:DNA-binding MarR family transcriptional regulator